MTRVNTIAPMITHDKYLKSRSGIAALYLGLSDGINGKNSGGHNMFHANEFADTIIQIADANTAYLWTIDPGEPFHDDTEKCTTGLCGDDANMANWPSNCGNVAAVELRIKQWKKHLNHSVYSSVLVLVCSKSSKYIPCRYRILKICEELSNVHRLSVWNLEISAWTCIEHHFSGCHDWVFTCTVYGMLNHASDQFLHGAMIVACGRPTAIDKRKHKLYRWFLAGIPRKNYNIDLEEWRRNAKSGIALTTTEMIKYQWEEKLKPALAKLQEEESDNGNLHKWDDVDYRNKKMTDLATSIGTNINRNPLTSWEYNLLTESMQVFIIICNVKC